VTRSIRQSEQILAWAEEGVLNADQLSALAANESLVPDSALWRAFIERVATHAGVVLIAVGVIFFFAWNWADMHRFAKLALAMAGLSGFTALAVLAAPFATLYRAALLGCCIATGALLALIGQIYQTGADIWQLFAIWAALIIPWVVISGSNACWGFFWALGNFALMVFFAQSQWQGLYAGLPGYQTLLVLALANGALLLMFEYFGTRLLTYPARTVQRLACLGVLTPLGWGASAAWWVNDFRVLLPIFLIVGLSILLFYLRQRRDLLILAMVLFWLIFVVSVGLVRVSMQAQAAFFLFNGIGLFVLVSSGLAALWLSRLAREPRT
jgi:uncharacterized membrane protein